MRTLVQVVVPGNHDVPLHNLFARFLRPLTKYQRYITPELEPFYADGEVAVLGVNTARAFTFKSGRINRRQVARIRQHLCPFSPQVIKVVVAHHPLDLPEGHGGGGIVQGARRVIETLAGCGANVILSGHLHLSHTNHAAKRYRMPGHSALVVQAGTATSTRGRGEVNSFNVIRLDHPEVTVERLGWQPDRGGFARLSLERFEAVAGAWRRLS
jgi:3',5'-cyclic AMP phosphodiesterase CpdA